MPKPKNPKKSAKAWNDSLPSRSKASEGQADTASEGPSDYELIRRVKNDDMDAFETLMVRHATKAYQIAYGVLGHRDDAEEVTQDAFVRIYRALPKFRGDSEFSTWMYRIVVNQARNKYRWNRRRGTHMQLSINQPLGDEDSRAFEIPDTDQTPDRELIHQEWHAEIAREIENLPEVNREALILRNV